MEPLLARELCGHRLTLKRLRLSAKGLQHPPAAALDFPFIHLQHTTPPFATQYPTFFSTLPRIIQQGLTDSEY